MKKNDRRRTRIRPPSSFDLIDEIPLTRRILNDSGHFSIVPFSFYELLNKFTTRYIKYITKSKSSRRSTND